ncbi:MAG: N-acetyltransferase [Muribaculaceae bacterium]|nr:N-acetyltransferase [Muribaculaceae bacterium]
MSVIIKPLKPTRSELLQYIKFAIDLYKGNNCYVPPLIIDEIATLSPKKNPAFDVCRAQSFMAYKDGRPVGRITGIINDVVNRKNNVKELRFGFVDFIDDSEVTDALFKAVENWGKDNGMDTIIGPLGFSDMDHEGMLIDGFNEVGTMATIYNYPYYVDHMVRLGFEKDIDWVEYRMVVPDALPEKYARVAQIVKTKFNLRSVPLTSRKTVKEKYGKPLFKLINEAYDNLYGFSPLTDKQIDYYVDQYLGLIRLDCVSVIVDKNDEIVAVGISMPSLSEGLIKSRGKLFPTGWVHLLKALKGKTDVVDLLLVAVKPEYQNKGVNALIFADLVPAFIAAGYKAAESNPELEGNESVQKQWEYFERRQHRKRRAWRKKIE